MTWIRGTAKFQDCERHGPGSGAELFIVEGDSASLSVVRVADSRTQAVLPLQGKPLNAIKANAKKIGAYPLFIELANALGTDMGSAFNSGLLRFERVLLLMDPDADGIHCGALMLMFFHKWMEPLLKQGQVHVVRAPVGEVQLANGDSAYGYDDKEFHDLCVRERAVQGAKMVSVRYRGLGAIDPEVLRYTCLCPESRRSYSVSVADAKMAEEIFMADVEAKTDL